MIDVEIKFDDRKLKNIQQILAGIPNAMPRIVSRAINRTAGPAKTQISRAIRQEINIKAGDLNKKIKVQKATFTNWEARIKLSTKRIPLMKFAARQTKEGVTYKIKKSGGRKIIFEIGFIARMSNAHRGVFARAEGRTHRERRTKNGKNKRNE